MMLAAGVTADLIDELERTGLATVTSERIMAGAQRIEAKQVRITDPGRRALAASEKSQYRAAAELGIPPAWHHVRPAAYPIHPIQLGPKVAHRKIVGGSVLRAHRIAALNRGNDFVVCRADNPQICHG
jgi:hypothetical protein